jgi:hypothetical protein
MAEALLLAQNILFLLSSEVERLAYVRKRIDKVLREAHNNSHSSRFSVKTYIGVPIERIGNERQLV